MNWICTDDIRYRWEASVDDMCSWRIEIFPIETGDGRLSWELVLRETLTADGSEVLDGGDYPSNRIARVPFPTERICRFAIDEVVRGIYDPFIGIDAGLEASAASRSDGTCDDDPFDAMMADFLAYCEYGRSDDGEGAGKRRRKKSARPKRGQAQTMLRVFDADGSRLYSVKLSRAEHLARDLSSVLPAKECKKGVRLTRPLSELGLTKSEFMEVCKALRKGGDPKEVFESLRRDSDL